MLSSQQHSHHLQHASWLIFSSMFVLIVVLLLNGCGTMGTKTPQGTTASFAFVTNSGSGTVSAFAVSTSGSLSLVSGGPFPAGAGAEFLTFDSVHKFLFVSNQSANTVSAFSVNTGTGMLAATPGSPFATGAR
ncbi:MAG TPA: beta-propeller fold lactonase family protein, partial [Candidatus Angelobacter sp.]